MIDCLLIGLWYSIRHFFKTGSLDWIEGHSYILKEEDENNQVLECKWCGHISEGWFEE